MDEKVVVAATIDFMMIRVRRWFVWGIFLGFLLGVGMMGVMG